MLGGCGKVVRACLEGLNMVKKIYELTHEEAIRALAIMTDRHQDFTFLSDAQVEELKRKERAALE